MDKHIPTNNKITGDKPSQQLFSKQVTFGLHNLDGYSARIEAS